jgi:PhnB protein
MAYTVAIGGGRAMAIKQINPYLNFNGTADKAIQLYQSALGAKVENIMRFGDAAGGMPVAPADKNRVLHAVLNLGPSAIMLSDTMSDQPVGAGGNVHITLDFDDAGEMTAKFDALGAGGKVTMPLQDTFWGARFGMLTDAYGIHWMFNCEQRKG